MRTVQIGTVDVIPNRSAALNEASILLIDINKGTYRGRTKPITLGELCRHYIRTELDREQSAAKAPKAPSTISAYKNYLKGWIIPRWDKERARDLEPVSIEEWLMELGRGENPLKRGTLAKIRNIMSAVWRHGLRHSLVPRDIGNPISLVRQSATSDIIQTILTVEEILALLRT